MRKMAGEQAARRRVKPCDELNWLDQTASTPHECGDLVS
jgi:hypothetical protein